MHYYQFNIGDYLSHTGHLDLLEDLAYRRMIEWCYLHESPLPFDVKQIAKKIRMQEHCDCITSVLQEFFCDNDDGWFNDRVAKELKSYKSLSNKRKKAANKRWANTGKASKGDASALQVESKSNTKQEPLTNNHKPLTKEIKTTPAKPKYEDCDLEFAKQAFEEILKVSPDYKKPNLETWAKDVRLMREVDGKELNEMATVWMWIRQDRFWSTNVLSISKFREKYDQLKMKMNEGNSNETNGRPTTARPDNSTTGRTRANGAKRLAEIAAQIAEIGGNDTTVANDGGNVFTQMDERNG